MQIGFILSLIFAILIAVFAVQNSTIVLVDFLFIQVEISQAIVILVSAALGAVIVTLLGIIRQIKLTLKNKELNKKVETLENIKAELENRIEEILEEIVKTEKQKEEPKLDEMNLETMENGDKETEKIKEENGVDI